LSFQPGPYGRDPYIPSPRTPGLLGINDAASPNAPDWLVGDSPGPLGFNDWASPQCEFFSLMHNKMGASPVRKATTAKDPHTNDKGNKANLKDDASTDIEALVKGFAKDVTAEVEKLRNARLEKQKRDQEASKKSTPASVPVVTFDMSPAKESSVRTPAQQAQEVIEKQSNVCWGAHMSDKARHVRMKVDGKLDFDYVKALGEDFNAFKKKWGEVMKNYKLKNYTGTDGWAEGADKFHLELPESRISRSGERALACLDEYARLTREEGKKKNEKFEKKYTNLLKPYVEKYEKKPGPKE
jgi:hypothetical protein